MIASLEEIINYIPQRPPFIMVGNLLSATESKLVSSFTIPVNNILVENDYFSESGLVENIAQTAAAGVGYKQLTNNEPINLGYIAAIKSLIIYKLPKVGEEIQTTIEIVNEVIDVTIVKAEIISDANKIAECEMRIFIKPR